MKTASVVIATAAVLPACTMPWQSEAARAELVAVSKQVPLCMPVEQLEVMVRASKTPHLEKAECGYGGCVLAAPLEFGAGNWILYIHARDGYVTSVLFRTEDSSYEHPAGAPKDRFTAVGESCGPMASAVERALEADGASRRPRW